MSKKTNSENQAIIEKLWKQYQKDNNPKWLAKICLNIPFFDHPGIGKDSKANKRDCLVKHL